jgi:mono/diheme cytochrome c family protein
MKKRLPLYTPGAALSLLALLACQKPLAPESLPTADSVPELAASPVTPAANTPANSPAAAAAVRPVDRQAAAALFAQRCTLCHGLKGHGNGPASPSLSPKPRDLSDPAWQDATSDATIRAILVGGGPAVGMSLMMPANADLRDKPELLAALVDVVRGLRR